MKSKNYKYWKSVFDIKRCLECEELHGKIYGIYEVPIPKQPLHFRCRCKIEILEALRAGTATEKKLDGADWWLKYTGILPEYYISQEDLEKTGWQRGKKPSKFMPERMLFGGEYENSDGHLPQKIGRRWFEADLDYKSGKRNSKRIVWSNDGLIFVTYDHYKTFIEIL